MSVQIVKELFQAHPLVDVKASKGFPEHLEECITPPDGLQDVYDLVSHLAGSVELISSPFSEIGCLAAKIKDVFDLLGLGLSCPQGVQSFNALSHTVSRVSALKFDHSLQVARAVKDVVMDSLLAVNRAVKIRLFMSGSGLAVLTAREVARYSIIVSATFLITDTSDLIRDCLEWQKEGQSEQKTNLALMSVVKNLSSLATSALVLVGYAFASIASEPLFISAIFISSSLFFISKFSSYFYAKMELESSSSPLLPA